jgi:hypothetical protein
MPAVHILLGLTTYTEYLESRAGTYIRGGSPFPSFPRLLSVFSVSGSK